MKVYYTGEKVDYKDPDAKEDFTLLELRVDHEDRSFSVYVEAWAYLAMCKGEDSSNIIDVNFHRWDKIGKGELEI